MRSTDEYDAEAPTCRACLTAPAPTVRKRAAPVTRTVRAPLAPVATEPRRPLTGSVGSGDMEARERRAKRTAWEQLAELHTEEYDQLLQVARRAEGLRT